jgi:excisionase family DNA binding protein
MSKPKSTGPQAARQLFVAVPQPRRRLTVDQAAAETTLSKFTIRHKIGTGELPHYKVGRRVILESEDVERLLAGCRIEGRESR